MHAHEPPIATAKLRSAISVVLIGYRQTPTVELALHALVAQDLQEPWDLSVLDDGTDPPALDTLKATLNSAPMTCRYVWHPHRGNGAQVLRNLGITMATAPFILFLDGDIICSPNTVRQHLETQRQEPRLVFGRRFWRQWEVDFSSHSDETPQQSLSRLFATGSSRDADTKRREVEEHLQRRAIIKSDTPWRGWYSASASAPRLPELLFDEEMRVWGNQDLELAYRMFKTYGLNSIYLEEARCYHVEREAAIFNIMRVGKGEDLVQYLIQSCYFLDRHPELETRNDLLMGFDRLALDQTSNTWRIVPRENRTDARETLAAVRKWLADSGLYLSKGVREWSAIK